MKLICTPTYGPLAIIVDIASGGIVREIAIPQELQSVRNRPYGITTDNKGHWYISNWDKIGCFDANFNLQYAINGLPENIHQIQYDDLSGELWVVATSADSLFAINLEKQIARRFSPVLDRWQELDAPRNDTQHFSSLRWHGGNLYVLAHKFGVEPSCLTIYNRDMVRLGQWNIGREAHSICEYNGQIFILDSRGGAILGNRGVNIAVGGMPVNEPELPGHSAGSALLAHYMPPEKPTYTRGMTITPQGFAAVAIFDFGSIETRSTGDAYLRIFDVRKGERVKEVKLSGVGNIQDIQLYEQPLVQVPTELEFYDPVVKKLKDLQPAILTKRLNDPEIRIPYDADRTAPDFAYTLSTFTNVSIDFAVRNNLHRIIKDIEKPAENILNQLLQGNWERSGGFWYPAASGWMDWHSNYESPGPRIYLVWCAEGGKSRFLYSPDGGRTMVEKWEPAGWSVNAFMIGNERHPFWHAVDSGGTDRISFGFKPKSYLHQFMVA